MDVKPIKNIFRKTEKKPDKRDKSLKEILDEFLKNYHNNDNNKNNFPINKKLRCKIKLPKLNIELSQENIFSPTHFYNYPNQKKEKRSLSSLKKEGKTNDKENNEKLLPNSKMIFLGPILKIAQSSRSVCKIETPEGSGSGFLIKLSKRDEDFFCLMTNEHVITKNMIENKVRIKTYYNNGKYEVKIKLNPYERIIEEFTYVDIDSTVVEILPKDNISTNYFLIPSIYYMYNFEELNSENISIIQYPKGKLCYSNGKINNMKNFTFSHSASTEPGSSGSPVFLKGTRKVIGIHKSSSIYFPENYGNFIGPIYKYFKDLPKYKYNLNNNSGL